VGIRGLHGARAGKENGRLLEMIAAEREAEAKVDGKK
jgi:hypothetical protein